MMPNVFVDNAKVMPKGQITIPKDIRAILGVNSGDRVTFVVEGDSIRLVNSAVYAMRMLQNQMAGEAEKAGIASADDVDALIAEMRAEDNE